MAAELQPPEGPISNANRATTTGSTNTVSTTAPSTSAIATTALIDPSQLENAGPPPPAPKRQRRPSVRLGEIGDQTIYETHVRRMKHHQWRLPKDSSKSVKARSLTNLVNGNDGFEIQESEVNTLNGEVNLEFGYRKKAKRGTIKRARSNWISKVEDDGGGGGGGGVGVGGGGGMEGDSREDGEEGFRDFDPESDSQLKEQSPVHSVDNVNAGLDLWHGHRRTGTGRGRVVESSRENEMDNNNGNNKWEGVRTWLIELGLSRYAPVFEIHEVDDEVLPMLTLEDLKDMGINTVGSRRKLYSAIQKLRKGFS